MKCESKLISMLSYTDDAVIIAEDETSMRLGSVGELRGVIGKLLEMLAGSLLLYRVEVCMGMWEEAWANR